MLLSFQVLCVIRLYHRERETTDTLLEISLERWCPFKCSPTSKDDSLHFKSSAVQWDCVSPLEQWCISLTECNKSWLHFTQKENKISCPVFSWSETASTKEASVETISSECHVLCRRADEPCLFDVDVYFRFSQPPREIQENTSSGKKIIQGQLLLFRVSLKAISRCLCHLRVFKR